MGGGGVQRAPSLLGRSREHTRTHARQLLSLGPDHRVLGRHARPQPRQLQPPARNGPAEGDHGEPLQDPEPREAAAAAAPRNHDPRRRRPRGVDIDLLVGAVCIAEGRALSLRLPRRGLRALH
jgi:hypothetical protein